MPPEAVPELPSTKFPILKVAAHMKGKLMGFPKNVPIAEAIRFPRNIHASAAATKKCSPMNGVKEVNIPTATPAAIACGVAVIRKILLVTYCVDRNQERRGHTQTRSVSNQFGGVRLLNNIHFTSSPDAHFRNFSCR